MLLNCKVYPQHLGEVLDPHKQNGIISVFDSCSLVKSRAHVYALVTITVTAFMQIKSYVTNKSSSKQMKQENEGQRNKTFEADSHNAHFFFFFLRYLDLLVIHGTFVTSAYASVCSF